MKANYLPVYLINPNELPDLDDLAQRAVQVFQDAHGYYINCEGASLEVKSFVEKNQILISQKVQELLKTKKI
jgi:hypothetical protein